MLRLIRGKRREKEGAFTLIEIVVATIILGILTSISIPMFNGVQRHAHESGVDSDLRSSANATVRIHGDRVVFATPEIFEEKATVTEGNNVVLFMVPDPAYGEYACVWASRAFAEGDVYSRYYNSKDGSFTDQPCIGLENEVITGVNPDTGVADDHEHDEGSDPDDPSANPDLTEGEGDTSATPAPGEGTGAEGGTNPQPPVTEPAPAPQPPVSDDPATLDPNLNLKGKFPVCHHPAGKKYQLLMLPYTALVSHGSHHNDVIPPIAGYYAGNRWNAQGIAIFNAHCA